MAQNYYNFQNNRRGYSQNHPFEYSYGYPYEMEKEDERNQTSNDATQKGIVFWWLKVSEVVLELFLDTI